MAQHNLIYIQASGEDTFNFSFPIHNSSEIEVFVEQNKKTYLVDYTLINLEFPLKQVKFNYLVGTANAPQMVLLKYLPNMNRVSEFNNVSQIRAETLNAEFNNMLNYNTYLQANVERSVKIPLYNNEELILPQNSTGKCLIWNENGNLENSIENINETLNTLLTFMAESQNNSGNNKNCDNDNNDDDDNNGGNTGNTVDSKEVVYSGGILIATNVEDALHELRDSCNLVISVPQLTATDVNSALDELSYATTISYTNENLIDCPNVQLALDNINQKVDDVISGKITLSQYNGIKHGLVAGALSKNGWGDFLTSSQPFKINVLGKVTPLVIAFSKLFVTQLGYFTTDVSLTFPETAGIFYYIYADLKADGTISINYTEHKPYYLGYNHNVVGIIPPLLVDAYKAPSDWFNIANYTMYNSTNQPLTRVYLGFVLFKEDGTPERITPVTYGDYYICDVKIGNANNKPFKINNFFGTDVVLVDVKFKSADAPFDEEYSYSYNLHTISADNSLNIGMNYSVNSQYIQGTFANPYATWYFSNPTSYWSANYGIARFHVKRLF
ncbi:putative phage protein [Candidatus Hepatincola sp. Av]